MSGAQAPVPPKPDKAEPEATSLGSGKKVKTMSKRSNMPLAVLGVLKTELRVSKTRLLWADFGEVLPTECRKKDLLRNGIRHPRSTGRRSARAASASRPHHFLNIGGPRYAIPGDRARLMRPAVRVRHSVLTEHGELAGERLQFIFAEGPVEFDGIRTAENEARTITRTFTTTCRDTG